MNVQLFFEGLTLPTTEEIIQNLPTLWHMGVDEAGRGCLAGPVVAGAVVFAPHFDFASELPSLNDSKKLSEKKRLALAPKIMQKALAFGLGFASPKEIDKINILNATFLAMSRACSALYLRIGKTQKQLTTLPLSLDHLNTASTVTNQQKDTPFNSQQNALPLFIDGNKIIPIKFWNSKFPLPQQTSIIDGDALVPSISAASVLAKTARDHLMQKLAPRYPEYFFAKHKGYGTKVHLEALKQHGACRLHRLTFNKVL